MNRVASRKRKKLEDNNAKINSDTGHEITSPIIVRGVLEFPLEPLKEHLTCFLCGGYFRDAHTIAECLHSFCKSCLFREYNKGSIKCPKCYINLGPDPYPVTIYDRTLQELVDKIFPELKDIDAKAERQFYRKNGIQPKKECRAEIEKEQMGDDEKIVTALVASQDISNVCETIIHQDEVEFDFLPFEDDKQPVLPTLPKSLLTVSGRLKVFQLKKFLVRQLGLSTSYHSAIEVRCNGDSVGDELSLTFVKRTRWMARDGLVLTYGLMVEPHDKIQIYC